MSLIIVLYLSYHTSKLLEIIVKMSIRVSLNHILIDEQHGFCLGRSTITCNIIWNSYIYDSFVFMAKLKQSIPISLKLSTASTIPSWSKYLTSSVSTIPYSPDYYYLTLPTDHSLSQFLDPLLLYSIQTLVFPRVPYYHLCCFLYS